MIDNEYLRLFSRYNQWQNNEIYKSAEKLSDEQRRCDHSAFWGSIIGTLSHIYWGDRIWLSRLNIIEAPSVGLKESAAYIKDWGSLKSKRIALDTLFIEWCDAFNKGPVKGNLKFFSSVLQQNVELPLSTALTHLFNHQTHHRGQVNALLSLYGIKTGDTDLFLMPKDL